MAAEAGAGAASDGESCSVVPAEAEIGSAPDAALASEAASSGAGTVSTVGFAGKGGTTGR
ncbi:hypothetical protein WJ59_34300 [Burkholderia gladioli]|nr:hypothetical protein LA03_13705 [Burkholderia gladioli]KVM58525.1 hypothetical protein WJ59_34300 [Burkholderia gladioli]